MRASLTPRQAAVLEWISDGCAIGAWPDDQGRPPERRLAAALLPDKSYCIEHSEYPPESTSRRETAIPRPPDRQAAAASHGAATGTGSARHSAPEPAAVSPTDELVARIQAAGGTLTVKV